MYHAHNYQITVKVKPQGNIHALHTGHGRCFVEQIDTDGKPNPMAIIRYDCNDGTRSRIHVVLLSEINFGRSGLTANGFKQI